MIKARSKRHFIHPHDVREGLFANERSYAAALHALQVCERIQSLINKGHYLFEKHDRTLSQPVIKVFQTKDHFSIQFDNVEFVGDEFNHVGIWCTKKGVNEFFKRYKCIHPKHLKSLI